MARTIAESIYNFLDVNNKLPVEQKACKKKSKETKDQSLTDKMIYVIVGREKQIWE